MPITPCDDFRNYCNKHSSQIIFVPFVYFVVPVFLRVFAPSREAKTFGFREIRAFRGSPFSRLSRISRFLPEFGLPRMLPTSRSVCCHCNRGSRAMTFARTFTITSRKTRAITCIEEAGREAT
jgi:hypothetical protein